MVGSKGTEIHPRPLPPSPEEIINDVSRASVDDPVFKQPHDILDGSAVHPSESKPLEDISNSPSLEKEKEICYVKVRDLLETLSSIRAGKDQLENLTQQLLSSKEDVSAVSLELKTRLEKHKVSSSRRSSS